MLSAEARGRLAVVLVGARNPQNIGAAARAMHDFGFTDLRVVNDFAPPFEAAQMEAKSAVRAEEVMRSAQLFTSLAEAIADCTTVAGTTAVGDRRVDASILPLKEVADVMRHELRSRPRKDASEPYLIPSSPGTALHPAQRKVALLFGSEKTGLTREQLSFCSMLLTIPMFAPPGRHLSMNLGQSVAVCLYELTRDGFEGSRELPGSPVRPATVGDRERLVDLVKDVMAESGYSRRFPANARPAVVRQLVSNLGRTEDEAATWMGLFRTVLQALDFVARKYIPKADS